MGQGGKKTMAGMKCVILHYTKRLHAMTVLMSPFPTCLSWFDNWES
jgi:hypothetical protein